MPKASNAKFSVQNLMIGGLVVVVIGAAFWLGKLTTELKLVKAQKEAGTQQGQVVGAQQPQVAPATVISDDQWQQLLKDPTAALGKDGAGVTIVEFTDFQCPFCKRAFDETFPEIKKEYVDTGKVKYVIRDLPLGIHANAPAAALASRCAADQNQYWGMHDELFNKQADWSNGNPDEAFAGYARSLGMNMDKFSQCYNSKKYAAEVNSDSQLAGTLGASGTPTFFINKRLLVGAQPFSAFKTVIEEELKK